LIIKLSLESKTTFNHRFIFQMSFQSASLSIIISIPQHFLKQFSPIFGAAYLITHSFIKNQQ
jgi:hypothetical protein